MIRLAVMRHAKSNWDDAAIRDLDRPLNARGRAAAERMGREVRARGVRCDMVLASPAVRVRETLERFAPGYGAMPPVRFDDRLYGASTATLIDAVRNLGDDVRCALLVGHNPGLHELVASLSGEHIESFPTAACALLDFALEDWSSVAPGTGRLGALIVPRALD